MSQHKKYKKMFASADTIGVSLLAEGVWRVRKEAAGDDVSELLASKALGQGVPAEWRPPIELHRALRKLYGEQVRSEDALALLGDETYTVDGASLRAWRESAGLSRPELGALLGTHPNSIKLIELGQNSNPGVSTWRRIERRIQEEE